MTEAAIVDIDIERLIQIDKRIDQHESTALRDRWEFGHGMLAQQDSTGHLPQRYVTNLTKRTGKSRSELYYRQQFAATYLTEWELSNALDSFDSWREVVRSLKRAKDAADNIPTEPPTVLEGQCATFVADPPWQYGNTSTRGAAQNHYNTMTIDQLCDLDIVPEHAADQAHLYLWTTAGHLPQAFDVMEAWGFDYKTYLVWVKPQMGMGNYFRISTEVILFGVKGGLRTLDRGIMNWFQIPRGKHSQKPSDFYDLVMRASPPPYGELFSRCYKDTTLHCVCSKCRLGWKTWGDQS